MLILYIIYSKLQFDLLNHGLDGPTHILLAPSFQPGHNSNCDPAPLGRVSFGPALQTWHPAESLHGEILPCSHASNGSDHGGLQIGINSENPKFRLILHAKVKFWDWFSSMISRQGVFGIREKLWDDSCIFPTFLVCIGFRVST